jgi:hypothetical protein
VSTHTKRRRRLVAAACVLLLVPAQAAAHGGGGGEASWHTWVAFLSLGVGVVGLTGGLYLDQKGTDRRKLSDIGVVGGACAIVLSAVLYWLV